MVNAKQKVNSDPGIQKWCKSASKDQCGNNNQQDNSLKNI